MQRLFVKKIGLCAALLGSLSACTYLIPDDPSVPRYNQVLGERHRPQNNINMPDAPQSDNTAAMKAFAATPNGESATAMAAIATPAPAMTTLAAPMPAPIMPVAETNLPPLPPVDASTQAQAAREMSMTPPAGEIAAESIRRAPSENPTELAQNDIANVPPRPVLTGSDAPAARLKNIRHDLEHERAQSAEDKAALAQDAASDAATAMPAAALPEPTGMVPVPPSPANPSPTSSMAPIQLAPMPVPMATAEAMPAPIYPMPTPPPAMGMNAAQPPLLIPPPPPPLLAQSAVTYTPPAAAANADRVAIQDNPAPISPVLAPIQLIPPGGNVIPAQLPPIAMASLSTPTASSFNPFETVTSTPKSKPGFVEGALLPESRYAARR